MAEDLAERSVFVYGRVDTDFTLHFGTSGWRGPVSVGINTFLLLEAVKSKGDKVTFVTLGGYAKSQKKNINMGFRVQEFHYKTV